MNGRRYQEKEKGNDKANGTTDSHIAQRSTDSSKIRTMTNSTRDGAERIAYIGERYQSNQLQKVGGGENVEVGGRKRASEV